MTENEHCLPDEHTQLGYANARVTKLENEIDRLRDALAWYGDEGSWKATEDLAGYAPIDIDQGKHAHEALGDAGC